MTLSFTTHWRDELPDFYTALAPRRWRMRGLSGTTRRWRDRWASPSRYLARRRALAYGAAKRYCRECRRWRRSTAATSLAPGPGSSATGAAFCSANSSSRTVVALTGT